MTVPPDGEKVVTYPSGQLAPFGRLMVNALSLDLERKDNALFKKATYFFPNTKLITELRMIRNKA